MAIFKTTSSDYTITIGPVVGGNGTGTMTISGNLDVMGNVTYIDTSELKITDPFITVAANNTGLISKMGMLGQKDAGDYAGLRYNNVAAQWEITSSTDDTGTSGVWSVIASGAVVGGNTTEIQFNNAGSFAGNINLRYDYLNRRMFLDGAEVLGNIGSSPAITANSITLYNKEQGVAGSGLYVISATADDEIPVYKKALLLSLVM